ncbi:calmodulin-binding transcription activator 4-like [Magnolia sinica]|uniref:calmodulin-binding transcription activator 4-like n=1 Tax=Magnolia sinica TaxID=86752 RepID=UPI00265A25AE|nr:calmodulin-binding transcription activator 4-like [Magnolia sinica]
MQSAPEFDTDELFQVAKNRWLKPAEISFILHNYDEDKLILEPPQNPPSGSLFLFNRKVVRFFRKDGYSWRKKKDGRSVGEAHERLKVGGVEALNCYYAHGEPKSSFQRRVYWLLDQDWEHIVLVHYREVTESKYNTRSTSNLTDSGSTFNESTPISNMQNLVSPSGISEQTELYQTSLTLGTLDEDGSYPVVGNNEMDHLNATVRSEDVRCRSESDAWVFRRLTEQLSLDDDHDDDNQFAEKMPQHCSQNENSKDSGFVAHESEVTRSEAFVDVSHGPVFGEHDQLLDRYAELHDDLNTVVLLQSSGDARYQCGPPLSQGYTTEKKESLSWKDMLQSSSSSTGIDSQEENSNELTLKGFPEFSTFRMLKSEDEYYAEDVTSHDNHLPPLEMTKISPNPVQQTENLAWQWQDRGGNNGDVTKFHLTPESNNSLPLSAAIQFPLGPENGILSLTSSELFQEFEKSTPSASSSGTSSLEMNSVVGMLGKTNSSDWLETRGMPVDSPMYSPGYYQMFDEESQFRTFLEPDLSLTISQIQRFKIREISPEWAYSNEQTKVIIVGEFLCNPSECAWACMFGDTEVPLEIIQGGVLCCWAPQYAVGKVNLCITTGNRESCSEVREFEYRVKPKTSNLDGDLSQADATKNAEELQLLVRFVEMLLLDYDSASVLKEDNAGSKIKPLRKSETADDLWRRIREAVSVGSETPCAIMDWLLQEVLKDKLWYWLSSKFQEGEGMVCSLSKQHKGIIHMIAGLGYEWALNLILNSGVSINFRDLNGWTALHWAARFGREKMVAALLAAGASAGAVTDPTPQYPAGKMPATIAADNGHKGLAAYLSEAALTSHLSSLTLEENEISKVSAAVEAEKTMKSLAERQIFACTIEDQLSLEESWAAAKNVAQAAARIQAAFRAHSFRKRQLRNAGIYENGMSRDDIIMLSAILTLQRTFRSQRDRKLNKAALSIQKKYRGWIRRKEFLTLKRNVVKIQAHVRGYQVRKRYKEILWMVSILEKVILRWRRRGEGLRGFRAELADSEPNGESEEDDILKVFRKHKVDAVIEEAVSRVLSMVECSDARQQYRRILERYRQAKAVQMSNSSEVASSSQGNGDNMEKGNNNNDVYTLG